MRRWKTPTSSLRPITCWFCLRSGEIYPTAYQDSTETAIIIVLNTHSASGLQQKEIVLLIVQLKVFGRVLIQTPISAEETFNRENVPHRNRLCFLCYFLCTSKESKERLTLRRCEDPGRTASEGYKIKTIRLLIVLESDRHPDSYRDES